MTVEKAIIIALSRAEKEFELVIPGIDNFNSLSLVAKLIPFFCEAKAATWRHFHLDRF